MTLLLRWTMTSWAMLAFIQLVVYPQRWKRARELSKDN